MNLLNKLDGKIMYMLATLAYFIVAGIMIYQASVMNETLKNILEKIQ